MSTIKKYKEVAHKSRKETVHSSEGWWLMKWSTRIISRDSLMKPT